MSEIAVIIQARIGSTRLPEKMIKPFFQGKSLIEVLLEEMTRSLDCQIILATSDKSIDDPLIEVAKKFNVVSFRGSEENVLSRFIESAKLNGARKIIRVCADNPFLQMEFLNDLINRITKTEKDYISYCFSDGTPTIKSHIGLFAEATTLNTLEKVASLTNEKLYIEHVTNFIYANPEKFDIELIGLPATFKDKTNLRFTLDTAKDFEVLRELYQMQKENSWGISELIGFVESNEIILDSMKQEIIRNSK